MIGTRPMRDLPAGARFIGINGDEYEVTRPASEDECGWVEVRNLSMSDGRAAQRGAEPGGDPRDGVFMSGQVEREVEVTR